MQANSDNKSFPVKLAKPALRALAEACITTLEKLSRLSEEELLQLHGIGQNAIHQIKKTLHERGLSFTKKNKN